MSDRKNILKEGLKLFSYKGNDSISMIDIATKIGMTESEIFNYFSSEKELLEAIVEEYKTETIKFYQNNPIIKNVHSEDKKNYLFDLMVCINMLCEMFFDSNRPKEIIYFKNFLTVERFRKKEFATLYNTLYLDMPIMLIGEVFSFLMENKFLKKEDPVFLAREFYYYIYAVLDGQKNEHESIPIIRKHISHFCFQYRD